MRSAKPDDVIVRGPVTFARYVESDDDADTSWLGEPEWHVHRAEYPYYDRDSGWLVTGRFCMEATPEQEARYEVLRKTFRDLGSSEYEKHPDLNEFYELEDHVQGAYRYRVVRKLGPGHLEFDTVPGSEIGEPDHYSHRKARYIHKFQSPTEYESCLWDAERLDGYWKNDWHFEWYRVEAWLTDDPEKKVLGEDSRCGIEDDADEKYIAETWENLEYGAFHELKKAVESEVESLKAAADRLALLSKVPEKLP